MIKETVVKLRVYDLSQGMAKQIAPSLGLDIEGIWHTSVEVFGNEYYFQRGVVFAEPGKTHYGKPHKILDIGTTRLTMEIFHEYIESMQHKYNESSYNLMMNNCNHFSNDATLFLCSKAIPDYILLLPEIAMRSPFYYALMSSIGRNTNEENRGGNSEI
eukprot:jgi/Antlo1/927/2443